MEGNWEKTPTRRFSKSRKRIPVFCAGKPEAFIDSVRFRREQGPEPGINTKKNLPAKYAKNAKRKIEMPSF
jgi:hypothetical protein